MAKASIDLVVALRATAARLAAGAAYQWGHHGQCNCGHLVQTLCTLEPRTIHAWAMEAQAGDWEMLANAYCPVSGHAIDDVIAALIAAGLTTDDLGHLERLDDERVLEALPGGKRWLERNLRGDAVAYLQAWADLLDDDLAMARDLLCRAA
jgi:hypothetical protein